MGWRGQGYARQRQDSANFTMGIVPGLNCGHDIIYLNVSNNLLLKIESENIFRTREKYISCCQVSKGDSYHIVSFDRKVSLHHSSVAMFR